MAVLMAVSAFAAALKKKAAVWKKAVKAEPRKGGGYGLPEIPDGRYEARISCESGITDKEGKPKIPWVRITATVSEGAHMGKEPSKFYYLDGKPVSADPEAMLTNEQQLSGDLKTLLPDVEVEATLAEDPGQLDVMLTEINERNPLCKIGIRNGVNAGGKNKGKARQDVFFNDLIEGGENHSSSDEESEEGSEEEASEEDEEEVVEEESEGEDEDGEEGEAESDDDGDESESDEPVAPAKGDPVMYQAKGAPKAKEYKVATVNQRKQTVTLTGYGKKYENVPWSKLNP